jgi:uridine kinase
MARPVSVIGIAGPVGAGKSTLAGGLAIELADAAIVRFDHYEQVTEQPIETIRDWMRAGADLDAVEIPQLAAALGSLKAGCAVVDPVTGRSIPPARYILFETQFGRRHSATGQYIDLMVWIDTPLDLALARKVRQFAASLDGADAGAARTFAPWLRGYLDNYLGVVGDLLRIQRETVGAGADLVVDGTRDPAVLRQEVAQLIRARLP